MTQKVYFKSNKQDWETPQYLFDKYNDIYDFTLDVCASKTNAKCLKYFSESEDGLSRKWSGRCWMNAPYGKDISLWIQKAYEESKAGVLTVALVPSRTDTRWFHSWALKGKVEFLKGRVKFVGAKDNAPFPSMIIVYGDL